MVMAKAKTMRTAVPINIFFILFVLIFIVRLPES
jgi:hypothetical protein